MKRWTQKFTVGYEGFYWPNTDGVADNEGREWSFPTLFQPSDSAFVLLTEANILRDNTGAYLTNAADSSIYKIKLSDERLICPSGWYSPWRVAIIGTLADIVESTLVTDVSEPCKIQDTQWIKPGLVSWIYWAYNHGSKDYQIVKKYIDFAADFDLPYMLIDWEWDAMGNGGNLNDAMNYCKEKNVTPLIWYNSSTAWCDPTPLYRQRTYPNLMSVEAVYGSEWYNNKPTLTDNAAWHNCTLPFTRNVIGPMDYTPCTFTNSQHPHITTDAHELALLVIFESALQHLADRPEGYRQQPVEVQNFIRYLPVAWEDTRLLSGYPAESVVIARKSKDSWYISGLNGTENTKSFRVNLEFIKDSIQLIQLFSDTTDGKQIKIENSAFDTKELNIECQPRGGFVVWVKLRK